MLNYKKIRGLISLLRPELPFAAGICVIIGEIITLKAIPSISEMSLKLKSLSLGFGQAQELRAALEPGIEADTALMLWFLPSGRISQKRSGNPQSRPHAGGKSPNLLVRRAQKPHGTQQGCQARFALRGTQSTQLAQQIEVLHRTQMVWKGRMRGQVANGGPHARRVDATALAQYLGPPRGGSLQSQQQPQRGRLARSVGSEQPIDRAAGDLPAEIVHGNDASAVDLRQMFGSYCQVHHASLHHASLHHASPDTHPLLSSIYPLGNQSVSTPQPFREKRGVAHFGSIAAKPRPCDGSSPTRCDGRFWPD